MKLQLLFVTLLAAQALGIVYKLEIKTGTKKHAGTDHGGGIYATLVGKNGKEVKMGNLDNPNRNDLEPGQVDIFTAHSAEDIGKIECVVLSTNKDDAWQVDYLVASSDARNGKSYFYNQGMFLSSDRSEGVAELELCEQGSETYYITTTTSTDQHSSTDNIHARVRITGIAIKKKGKKNKKGKKTVTTTTGYLDNPNRNDFQTGNQDTFVFQGLTDVGRIKCVEVIVEGDDAWKFDMIEIHSQSRRQPTYLRNEREAWLSSDLNEGSDVLKLCRA